MKSEKQALSRIRLLRVFYIITGCITLGLGVLGAILPVLPATPFLLASTWCFAKGSRRFYNWFVATKFHKKHISGFMECKAMSLRSVLVMMLVVVLSLCSAMYFINNAVISGVLCFVLAFKFIYFYFKVKIVSEEELEEMKHPKGLPVHD